MAPSAKPTGVTGKKPRAPVATVSNAATEEAILARIAACGSSSEFRAGLCEQVRAYVEGKEGEDHARAKQLVPFLGRVLKQCAVELGSVPVDGDTVGQRRGDELFGAMGVALDAFDRLRCWLVGGAIEIEIQRYSFMRRLVAWKRYREAAGECRRVLSSLNAHILSLSSVKGTGKRAATGGQKCKEVQAMISILPPPRKTEDITSGLPALIAGLVADLIICTIESGESHLEVLQNLANLPLQLEPWLRTMDPAAAEKQRESLFKGLYRISSIMVSQSCFKGETILIFCKITLHWCARSSQLDQYLKVARRLCSSLISAASLTSVAMDICAAVYNDLGCKEELRKFWRSCELLDFMEWYSKVCQNSENTDLGWHHIWKFLESAQQVDYGCLVAISGLYALSLKLPSNYNDKDMGITRGTEWTGYCRKAEKLLEDAVAGVCAIFELGDSDVRKAIKVVDRGDDILGECRAYLESENAQRRALVSVFKALDSARRNLANYVQLEWDLFLSSDGEAEHSTLVLGLIKLLHLFCQTVPIGLRHDNLSPDEKEVFRKGWHAAPTAAVAALRLSLMVRRALKESTLIIRDLISTIAVQSEELRWLISVTYNIGVQIYNKKQYDLACGPLELAHDAAWSKVDALTRISRAEDQSLIRDAVSEACLKTSAFVDCLKRSGNQNRGNGILLNAVICWTKARSQGFELEGPQSLLKLWMKSSLVDPQISREECCMYSSLCCLQPPLPAASIGLLLEEQLLVLDDIDYQRTDIEVVKERILEVLIDKVYLGESFALERSRILVEKTRIARRHGINSLRSSIMLLSEALHLLKEALQKKDTIGQQKMRLEYQSAVAYCLRAHCSQEADPFSQEYIADITSAIKLWRDLVGLVKAGGWNCFSCVNRKSVVVQSKESVLCVLRSTADLLSLKGISLLLNEMQELILEVAGQEFPSEDQGASIWADSRISHVLCPVPFSKSFISIFAKTFGSKVDMISFWCNYAKTVPGSLANARQSLVYVDILGDAYDGENFPQEFSEELKRIINMARSVPPNGSNSVREISAFAAVKFYLAELLTQKGDIGAALKNATSCLQLRLKLLNRAFQISNRDAGHFSSDKKTSSKFEASGTAATFAWPSLFTTNSCHGISQWHILGDYIESLMQVGVLHEKVGAADDAERSFREGLWLSQAQNLPLASALFASCLGEVHRKQHLWDFAEEDFHDARKAFEDLNLDCICSHCVLIGKAYLELRVGDFFRRFPKVDDEIELSSAAGKPDVALMHYESAVTVLNDLFCFQEDSGKVENSLVLKCNKRSKKLSENARKESSQEFLHIKLDNKVSMAAWIGYKWEQCGRRLMAKLLLQKGKCNFELGRHDRVEEYYLQTMSLLYISQCCLPSSHWDWQLDNKQSMYPLEEAALLYHLSLLRLSRRANRATGEESAPPITWLYRAFILCSSAPPLLRKVSQLLAILHALDVSYFSTGKSSIEMKELAAYFHQASLGSRIRQQHLLMLESKLDVLQTQQEDQHKSKCIEEMIQALSVFREDNVNPAAQFKNLMDGLPPTTVCCISLLEKEFSFLLRTENSEYESTVATWLLVSRFGDGDVLVSILPVQCVPQDFSSERHDIGWSSSDVKDGENENAPEASDRRWRHRSILESDALVKNILAELASILQESRQSTSCLLPISTSEEKSRWWKWRTLLDVRLASLLRKIEDSWFGPWKCFLLGEPSQVSVAQAFQKKAKELCKSLRSKSFLGQNKLAKVPEEALVKVLLQGVGSLDKEQLHKAISCILGWESHEHGAGNTGETALCKRRLLIEKAAELFLTSFASVASGDDPMRGLRSKTRRNSRKENLAKSSETSSVVEREPIVLVLDGRLQSFPWESLPIMRKFEAYRMPSLGSIKALFLHHKHAVTASFGITESLARLQLNEGAAGHFLKGVSRPSVNPHSAFYLLNPGGDLESTQAAFEEWFTRQNGWEGKAGQVPTIDEYMAGLQQHDLFVYLGHGSGDQYFPEKYLRKLDNCPASLLMGCSSGRFSARGDYEPVGVPLSYLMAGCSLAIANLWDVTDGDIDRFSRVLLQRWLYRMENPSSEVRAPADAKAPRRGRSSKALQEADTESQSGEWEEIRIGPSVEAGRESCRLPYLIGASPVCYGIPTIVLRSRNCTKTCVQY